MCDSQPLPDHEEGLSPKPEVDQTVKEPSQTTMNKGLVEGLLDPKMLQTLMLGGGGLTVLGLVIWLVAKGLFEDPLWAAAGLTTVNLGLLATGVGVAGKTRYRTAGRAVAMLASVVLPLNLWFYDAQGLVTLDQGGNLWIPALLGCMVYAGVARYLKDSLFVYTFVSGVALSGMLFLADANVGHFWEVLVPSTLLVVLGTLAIHVERLFPEATNKEEAEPFTRDDFGFAFFRSGHMLLASGLAVLLGGRVVGWFYDSYFDQFNLFAMPDVAEVAKVQLFALFLVMAGAYNYAYSRLVVGTGKRYSVSSLLTVCWAVVIGFDLLNVTLTPTLVFGLFGGFALLCRLLEWALSVANDQEEQENTTSSLMNEVAPVASAVAHGMSAMGLLVSGFYLFNFFDGVVVRWDTFVALALLFGSFAVGLLSSGALSKASEGQPVLSWRDSLRNKYLSTGSLVTLMLTLLAVMECYSLNFGPNVFSYFFLVPVAMLVLVAFSPNSNCKKDLLWSSNLVSGLLVFSSYSLLVGEMLTGGSTHFPLFFGLSSAYYAALGASTESKWASGFSALLACTGVWQLVGFFELGFAVTLLVVSLVGLGLVAFDYLGSKFNTATAGWLFVLLGNAAGGLMVANRLLADEANYLLLAMLLGQAVAAFFASWLLAMQEEQKSKSQVLVVLGVVGLMFSGLTLNNLSDLSGWQRFELLVTSAGALMLAAGHLGWYREEANQQSKRSGLVDLNLWLGSFLATLPCTLTLLVMRLWGDASGVDSLVHETGALLVGLLLLGFGLLCRLRSTTLTGGSTVLLYLLSLVALFHVPDQLQNVAVYLMVGGGVFFGTAVMLSVYRDRLLAVTEQVREREGVFSVLSWR